MNDNRPFDFDDQPEPVKTEHETGYNIGYDIGYIMGHVHLLSRLMNESNPAQVSKIAGMLSMMWLCETDNWQAALKMCLESMTGAGEYNWVCTVFNSLLPDNMRIP